MINSYLNQAALLKKMITIIFCVLLFPLGSLGQETTVKGKVVSSDNQPLPGVTIVVKGTSAGTISDVDGNYVLPNIPNDAILLIWSLLILATEPVKSLLFTVP